MPLKYVANAKVDKVSVENFRVLNESFGVFLKKYFFLFRLTELLYPIDSNVPEWLNALRLPTMAYIVSSTVLAEHNSWIERTVRGTSVARSNTQATTCTSSAERTNASASANVLCGNLQQQKYSRNIIKTNKFTLASAVMRCVACALRMFWCAVDGHPATALHVVYAFCKHQLNLALNICSALDDCATSDDDKIKKWMCNESAQSKHAFVF